MKVLHIVATPRGEKSNTLQVSTAFLDSLSARRADVDIEVVDLFHHDLPALAGDNIEAKYTLMAGQPIDRKHEESWHQIEKLIADFLSADVYVLSVPMWNFGIPYVLKYYIDCIVQPGYVFRFNEGGMVVPMVTGKSMVCVTARGGDYSPGSPLNPYDFQQPYLRAIFGFIGIADIHFINLQPTDVTTRRETARASALAQAHALAASWSAPPALSDVIEEPVLTAVVHPG
jgi:FMN-dependent NADH-azoreductase